MRYIYTGLVLLLLLCLSCENIDKNDLTGKWALASYDKENEKIFCEELIFNQDSVAFTDRYSYKQVSYYQIFDNQLHVELKDDLAFRIGIEKLDNDTLTLDNGLIYYRVARDEKEFYFKNYPLIGIETQQLLDSRKRSHLIHYFKSRQGERRIKAGESFTNFNDLPLYFYGSHHKNRKSGLFVFIGEGINLLDIKVLYFKLEQLGFNKATLVLNRVDFENYEVFIDRIDVWQDDYLNFIHEQGLTYEPLPPPMPYNIESRQVFLGEQGELIRINSNVDFDQFSSLKKGKNYVVLINNTMSIEEYIELKKMTGRISLRKQINIMTEIL